jgi:hypothetical protein
VLGGFGLGRGVLWVGAGEGRVVGDVQAAGKKSGGVLGCYLLFSSFFQGLGRGRGDWVRPWHRPEAWQQGCSELEQRTTVKLNLVGFASASVRRNARKSLKFKFLKFSSLSDQHIGQGF